LILMIKLSLPGSRVAGAAEADQEAVADKI